LPEVDLNRCKAVIFGCSGPRLLPEEATFFAKSNPFGFILFARNVEDPEQLRQLIQDLRTSVGRSQAPVLMDQEGGRVQRLKPPHWRAAPAPARFGELYAKDSVKAFEALRLNSKLIAAELHDIGVDVDCTPCLDLNLAVTSTVIGDRAFSADPNEVAQLGQVVADTLLEEGIMPVIKHLPGHGRAMVDSHYELPVVSVDKDILENQDFVPFSALSGLPWAMTAHMIFEALDPDHPATQSKIIIRDIIRGKMGFKGVLLSDDINMEALSGTIGQRAGMSLEAGCDAVLHCSGELEEMIEVDMQIDNLSAISISRIDMGRKRLGSPTLLPDIVSMKQRLSELLEMVEE
jgi:beta-N-acetylhexosaminidase